ncbi:AAA family ATPase [Tritonibacter aquimaris]|uniref:AAA family ATPase n=1 Tax=Tritonibacter aquimaris TaxID=2663379 RepID=UPI0018864625
MIENIFLANEGSYDSDGAELSDLKDVNFIFGSNGAGKTTISRVIEEPDERPACKVSWKDGVAMESCMNF